MTRTVYCLKLKKNLIGFDTPPYPGELGQRVYEHISEDAWRQWLDHQTMLINEYRLNLLDPKAREFLETHMEQFLFTDQVDMPPGYQPPSDTDAG